MARSPNRLLVNPVCLLGVVVASILLAATADAQGIVPAPPEIARKATTPTEVVATVGDQMILAGDLLPTIDQMLQEHVGKVPPDQLDQQRVVLVQQMLPRKIEVKLVILDFYRTIPSDKQKEVLGNINKQVEKEFYGSYVATVQKQLDVESLTQLDIKLKSFRSSIEMKKNEFREQMIAQTIIGQKIDKSPEITHRQLLEYYHQHTADYDVAARARWEKLTARFDKYPDKAAAERAIVEMGNQVLRGADFAAVAKKLSQGTNADAGGYHDWTTKGSLVSEVVDHAIFTLPIYKLSQILEDERGFHIVRVLEREEASRIEFVDAQDEIREKLQEEDRKRQVRDYIKKLHDVTYVWTIFDETPKLAGPDQTNAR